MAVFNFGRILSNLSAEICMQVSTHNFYSGIRKLWCEFLINFVSLMAPKNIPASFFLNS